MILALLLLATDVPALPLTPEAQAVATFEQTCVRTFPDFEKIKAAAEAAGWEVVPNVPKTFRLGDLLLPRSAVHLHKEGYDVVTDDSRSIGHSCRLHVQLTGSETMNSFATAAASGLQLPPASLDAKQNQVEWTFRDGRRITIWRLLRINTKFFLISIATPATGQ